MPVLSDALKMVTDNFTQTKKCTPPSCAMSRDSELPLWPTVPPPNRSLFAVDEIYHFYAIFAFPSRIINVLTSVPTDSQIVSGRFLDHTYRCDDYCLLNQKS